MAIIVPILLVVVRLEETFGPRHEVHREAPQAAAVPNLLSALERASGRGGELVPFHPPLVSSKTSLKTSFKPLKTT